MADFAQWINQHSPFTQTGRANFTRGVGTIPGGTTAEDVRRGGIAKPVAAAAFPLTFGAHAAVALAKETPGAAAKVSHAVDVSGKLQNEFKDIGASLAGVRRGFEETTASFGRGLSDFQRQQSAAFGEALQNVLGGAGRGVGEGAYYFLGGIGAGVGAGAEGALGGIASGFGGGAATAASGIGEGVKALAIPALLVIGLFFLSKKAK